MSGPATPKPRKTLAQRLRRLAVIIALTVLVVFSALAFYIYHFLYLTMGEGPAGPPVDPAAFASPWTQRPVLLVGIGDSITDGFGASRGKSYFQRLTANPPDEFADMRGLSLGAVLPNMQSLNLAISTTTSDAHLQVQIPKLPVQSPDVLGIVVMTSGGNDIIHDYGRSEPRECAMYGATFEQAQPWIASYETRLNVMLDQITARFPGGCHIFLANIYDPTDGVGSAKWLGFPGWPQGLKVLAAYNQVIARTADARPNVHLVDIHTPMLGHGLSCRKWWAPHYDADDPHFWYLWILEDPNDRGYDCIRRTFLNAMIPVLPPAALRDPP